MKEDIEPQTGFPDPPPGVPVRELAFLLPDLPDLRDFTALQARKLGLREETVADLILAVNEVATNAVIHGTSAKARLRIWPVGGDLVVEVHDDGKWLPTGSPGSAAPGPRATSGMGLWVARSLAADLAIRTGARGSTVTMRFGGRGLA